MRHCHVVLRKAEGTDWPPPSVEHRGTTTGLEAIFAAAGIALVCRRGPDLPPLAAGRPFEPADLRAALPTAPGGPDWTAVVLIVPEILDRAAGRGRRPLGVMFGRDAGAREGCAVAYRRVGAEPRGYLRTLAHELGHLFNLAHPGERGEPFELEAVNTLMVPTDRLRPPGRFPETIEFRFAASQHRWLADAPERYVRPGGLPFGARPPDWPAPTASR